MGFPIRKSADQSLFAAPHGLSQRTTSFIASQRQGIHRIPLRHLIALIINIHHPPSLGGERRSPNRQACSLDTIERPVLLQTCPGTCGQATPTAGDARNRSLRTDQRPEHVSSSRCQISQTLHAQRRTKLFQRSPWDRSGRTTSRKRSSDQKTDWRNHFEGWWSQP